VILIVDNYDSFTWNLAHRLGELGAEVEVRRNDAVSIGEIDALGPTHLVVSPGPGRPEQAGISVDALASAETPVPGSLLQVAVRVYGTAAADSRVTDVQLRTPPGWILSRTGDDVLPNERRYRRRDNADSQASFDIRIPADAEFTHPYWLRNPRDTFTYDWSEAGNAINQPFDEPLLLAEAIVDIGGATVTVRKEVEYRYADRVRGEIRRRLDVVPALSVDPAADLLVLPASTETRVSDVLLTLRNNSDQEVTGTARSQSPLRSTSVTMAPC